MSSSWSLGDAGTASPAAPCELSLAEASVLAPWTSIGSAGNSSKVAGSGAGKLLELKHQNNNKKLYTQEQENEAMMGWAIKLKAFESVIQLSLSIIQESKISLID